MDNIDLVKLGMIVDKNVQQHILLYSPNAAIVI